MASEKPVTKERFVAKPGLGVGNHRYALYAQAWAHTNAAISQGFHLEAITLLESLISDRMESRASYLTNTNIGFKNLGKLIEIVGKHEIVDEFRQLIDRIDKWREKRNRALHEMVKFETGTYPTWAERCGQLEAIAREGQSILRDYAQIDERERGKVGLKPATWPNVFDSESRP